MPRYNVNYNDKLACFSSIVDGFVSEFMNEYDYNGWRNIQRGDHAVSPRNIMTMKEAVSSIRMHNSHNESVEELVECGISQEESESLIYDIESEHYCPIPKENGMYECPNCGSEVEKGQVECKDETCELEFVWR